MNSKEDIWVYSLSDMSWNLEEIDQELQGRYMRIFLIRCVLKGWGSRPWAPKRIYEYIPYEYRRLGGVSSPLGRPPRTGKSFRVVHACVRAACMPSRNRIKNWVLGVPFSLLPRRPFPFPFCHLLSLFPRALGFPLINMKSMWNQSEIKVK